MGNRIIISEKAHKKCIPNLCHIVILQQRAGGSSPTLPLFRVAKRESASVVLCECATIYYEGDDVN